MQNPGDLPESAPFSTQKIELSTHKYTPRPVYDFIILDCPPSVGAVTLNALNAADMLIIPTQPEYFSAHALRSMMGAIQQIRNRYNPNLVYRILITMFDKRNRIHREVEQQIRDTFKSGVFNTHIGVDTQLRESALQGLPITHFKTSSRSSQQYNALAQELIAYVQSKSTD
jgi:chromosome partitioning protein